MFEEIRKLIELDLPIIPLCSHNHSTNNSKHIERCKCPGKTPLIKNWEERKSTTIQNAIEWKKQFGNFNIGLPLGDASGYCGIDVDGDEGKKLLLEMSGGNIPATWEFVTGSGFRLLYLIPEGVRTKKFTAKGKGVHEECALLCNGQQTVLPPSIHYTGAAYQWCENRSPWDLDCALAPEWLLKLISLESETITITKSDIASEIMLTPKKETAQDILNLDMIFESKEEFDATIPDNMPNKEKRNRKGKSGHKIVVTEELLTSDISEGSRDNTMTAIVGHYCANVDLRRLGKEFILDICLKHNAKYCKPPLSQEDVTNKVSYFFEQEKIKSEDFASKKKGTDRPQFSPMKMSDLVKEQFASKGLIVQYDPIYKYYYWTTETKGPWRCEEDVKLINRWIREIITKEEIGGSSLWDGQRYIDEVRKRFEETFMFSGRKSSDFDLGEHADELSPYIVLRNGILDWKEGELMPWTPQLKTTICFDVAYDPEATCPKFERYLSEWLPELQTRMVIQEYLGYCLIPNTNFRRALFLYGRGKNGKSVLLEFIQDFFKGYSFSLSYDELSQKFGPANLKDKLVNICDDTTISFTKDTSIIKNLIAGGTLSAEFKGINKFMFKNTARLIFSSQETPRSSDLTPAWIDRWFFIKFPNHFRPSNAAKNRIHKDMQDEKAGILNWMLEGLKRLMENDDFTVSTALEETTKEYQRSNNNVLDFVEMFIKEQEGCNIPINTLFNTYKLYCEEDGKRPVSKNTFNRRIEDTSLEIKKIGRVVYAINCNFDEESEFYEIVKLNNFMIQVKSQL